MVREKGNPDNLPAVYQSEKSGRLRIPDDVFQGVVSVIQDNYTDHVTAWVRWMDGTGYGPDMNGVGAYFTWLNGESGYMARTIAIRRQAVKRRFRDYALSRGPEYRANLEAFLKEFDRAPQTKSPKVNNEHVTRDRVLREDDFFRLVEACKSDRQRGFVLFLRATACRVSEAAGVLLSGCNAVGDVVTIRILGKGKKERYVKVSADLFRFLRETFEGTIHLFETSTGHPYKPGYISDQVRTIGRKIGRKISAHTLRHSWATNAYEAMPDKLQAISEYLGHSSPSITMAMYVHSEFSNDDILTLSGDFGLWGEVVDFEQRESYRGVAG